MNLFPLSRSQIISAQELADIHLEPTMIFGSRILNAVFHRKLGNDLIITYENNQVSEYSMLGAEILPPLMVKSPPKPTSTSIWVQWAEQEYRNAWWIYGLIFFCNKERMERLKFPASPILKMCANWNAAGLLRKIKTLSVANQLMPPEKFPITPDVMPFQEFGKDEVYAYGKYYKSLLAHTRARWTGREIPSFYQTKEVMIKT